MRWNFSCVIPWSILGVLGFLSFQPCLETDSRVYNEKREVQSSIESNNSYSKTGVESYASSQHTPAPKWGNHTRVQFTVFLFFLSIQFPTRHLLGPPLLVAGRLGDIEAQAVRIQVHLVLALLQDLGNVLGVLEFPQVDIGPGLLDGITNELGGTCLTLGADDGSLLLLAGLVDDEGGPLSLLLRNLLGFDCGSELGGESQMLDGVSTSHVSTLNEAVPSATHRPT